jgi:hypothetical protein
MKMKIFILISGILLLNHLSFSTFGQQRGEVQNQEFVIRKDRVLSLPNQPRTLERIPSLPTPKSSTSFKYTVQPFFLSLPPKEIEAVASTKNFPKIEEERFPGFARLGYGNFQSPLIEGRYHVWEDQNYDLGVNVFHQGFYRGPVGGKNSAEDNTNATVSGTLFKDSFMVSGGLIYDRKMLHYYGYDPENINNLDFLAPQNVLNTFKLHAGIGNLEKMSFFNYDVATAVRRFNDQFQATESEFQLNGKTEFWIVDHLKIGTDLNASLTNTSDVFYNSLSRNYLKIHPHVRYIKDEFDVTLGANLVVENDVIDTKSSNLHIFPFLSAAFMFNEEMGVFATYKGDVVRNTYLGFVSENQFLGPSNQLLNTIQKHHVEAGVKGNIAHQFSYQAGVRYGNYNQLHFYGLNNSDSLKFNLLYDGNSKVINYFTNLSYSKGEFYQLLLNGNYYHYQLSDLRAPLHRPEWDFLLNNNFKPHSKWLIQGNVRLMGGLQGSLAFSDDNPVNPSIVQLPTIIDVQLKADFKLTPQFSLFAEGNNLLNRTNQRFINYPVRGIQGIGGITMKF